MLCSLPPPYVVGPKKSARFARGDVLIDDEFSRLYIVLKTWWSTTYGRQYKVVIIADWSGDAVNFPGDVCQWGEGVEEDALVGQVELPANM